MFWGLRNELKEFVKKSFDEPSGRISDYSQKIF